MKILILPVLGLAIMCSIAMMMLAQAKQTFTGVITDSMCSMGDHSRMKMGPTDPECTIACVRAHDAEFVLYDGNEIYSLSDHKTPEKFAGKKVTVRGALDAKTKTIKVDSIVAAKGK